MQPAEAIGSVKFTDKLKILREKQLNKEEIKAEDKIKVLALADSPTCSTGFGHVAREIMGVLHGTGLYDFEIVGINYDGHPHNLPYRIWPAFNGLIPSAEYRDVYGRQKLLDLAGSGKFDLIWILQDTFIVGELINKLHDTNVQLPPDKKFATIYYYPIDATPIKRWIDLTAHLVDFPVAYTKYAYNETLKLYDVDQNSLLEPEDKEINKQHGEELAKKLNVIYHGSNLKNFYPLTETQIEDARKKYWGDKSDRFVFINVNRNQPRKDLFRTLEAYKILMERRKAKGKNDVYLYMHCNIFDLGFNLIEMSNQLGLVHGDEWAFPDPKGFAPSSGYPLHMVNELYNASDAVVTTTLGEGWGLSLTEGFATKKLVIAPDNTSIPEILGKTPGGAERGIIVPTKERFVQDNDNSRVRPITDVEKLADAMEWCVENKHKLSEITDRAYEWVKEHTWDGDTIGGKWKEIFAQAYENAMTKRALALDALIRAVKEQENPFNDVNRMGGRMKTLPKKK